MHLTAVAPTVLENLPAAHATHERPLSYVPRPQAHRDGGDGGGEGGRGVGTAKGGSGDGGGDGGTAAKTAVVTAAEARVE